MVWNTITGSSPSQTRPSQCQWLCDPAKPVRVLRGRPGGDQGGGRHHDHRSRRHARYFQRERLRSLTRLRLSARIINYGQISASPAGPVFLIANEVENHGAISAPGGNIGLYAGQQVMVSSRPDGRGLSATVTLPKSSVNNSGQLIADAGTIALQAQVVTRAA